jgi:hypothetical protein
MIDLNESTLRRYAESTRLGSLHRPKQNETDEEFDIRMDNIKYELDEQGGGCVMAAPGMRSDED